MGHLAQGHSYKGCFSVVDAFSACNLKLEQNCSPFTLPAFEFRDNFRSDDSVNHFNYSIIRI